MYILTAAQMRAEEARGFASGISYGTMMRTAGNAVADLLEQRFDDMQTVTVVCGKGKNGGDGFVAAKRFAQQGKKVYIVLAMGQPTDALARKMYLEALGRGLMIFDYQKVPQHCKTVMQRADLLIDAVFGIGFAGDLRGSVREIAELYNTCGAYKAAVDLPSGLSADSPALPTLYFHADYTVTMHTLKPVHFFAPAQAACGEVLIADIGFPPHPADTNALFAPDQAYIKACFPLRKAESHKGTYGYALSVCGSKTMPGAAVLAARAAGECGAGLTAAAFPDGAYFPLTAHLTEQIFIPCQAEESGGFSYAAVNDLKAAVKRASAILFGCGVGTGNGAAAVLEYLLTNTDKPLIIDADGINLLALHKDILSARNAPTLLTPHPGEMSRLTGLSVAEINADRTETAKAFAAAHNVTVLLKGHRTVIAAPDGSVFINPTGNPGMAVGGSGDMLSGMILSFAAQGLNLTAAAVCGAYLHGSAGDAAAKRYSMRGTTPLRMLEMLPQVLAALEA
ncbi:MAG: NAD(P)H-hydrate dehydratase [Clostridia bacterium]|nr:NAD(P)H-hydrate dehydratase [Clostridia bacterium]